MYGYKIRKHGELTLIDWCAGFDTEEDAQQAADEAMTSIIDEYAEGHPDMTDLEIEDLFDVDVRED